jgi:16S rRNA (guanine966-N2)-methyltransferase
MKDRTREAVMNLLGGTFPDSYAFDLFGGSGILAFEAISRGAKKAVIWEILRPRATDISRFAKELGLENRISIISSDVLRWTRDGGLQSPDWAAYSDSPWLLFVCPPYRMWESDGEELRQGIAMWLAACPPGSLVAIEMEVETDERWLPDGLDWDIRRYAPAKIAIAEKATPCPSPQASPP